MSKTGADGMAISVDPDQTGSALFAKACMSVQKIIFVSPLCEPVIKLVG